ncbi:hypothetical protein [Pseudomonas quasicaspiana]|uniref:hypothetical protein n=1 Tax=Pseudomonas quasicaspiana TaxID=2829821 RepID=UPI001E62399B|nr:hypothetical protein [Pseudomonas quasicaspiana]MCD5978978.1 hypothetical protein [Pseudomonas quasicaspiana]
MFSALAITIIGSVIFLKPEAAGGSMSGLGDGLFFFIWVFGLAGTVICFIGNATGKTIMAMIGFGWSSLSLIGGFIAHRCVENDLCSYDTSQNVWLAAICLVILASLLLYDKKKEKIAPAGKTLIKVLARSMVGVWTCVLLLALATFNKPLPLQIDRTAHPTTEQFGNQGGDTDNP